MGVGVCERHNVQVWDEKKGIGERGRGGHEEERPLIFRD